MNFVLLTLKWRYSVYSDFILFHNDLFPTVVGFFVYISLKGVGSLSRTKSQTMGRNMLLWTSKAWTRRESVILHKYRAAAAPSSGDSTFHRALGSRKETVQMVKGLWCRLSLYAGLFVIHYCLTIVFIIQMTVRGTWKLRKKNKYNCLHNKMVIKLKWFIFIYMVYISACIHS